MKKKSLLLVIISFIFALSSCGQKGYDYKGVEIDKQNVNNIERMEEKYVDLVNAIFDFNESENFDSAKVAVKVVAMTDEFEKIDKKDDLFKHIETLFISKENDYAILTSVYRAENEQRPLNEKEMEFVFNALDTYLLGFSKLIVLNFDDNEEMKEVLEHDLKID